MTDVAPVFAQGLADIGAIPARRKDRPVRVTRPADLAWQDQAACIGMDPELFYPERHEGIPEEVLAACRSCDAHDACLEWALDHEHFGIWAGTSERQRRMMRRRRKAL